MPDWGWFQLPPERMLILCAGQAAFPGECRPFAPLRRNCLNRRATSRSDAELQNAAADSAVPRPEPAAGEETRACACVQDQSPRRGVALTGQRFFYVLGLMLVLMPLAYVAGMLVGRHQLDRELSASNPMTMLEKRDSSAPVKEDVEAQNSQDGILKPQELTFARVLRAAPGEKILEPGQLHLFKPLVPQRDGRTAEENKSSTAPGTSQTAGSINPSEPPEREDAVYDFVFQIAAFHSATKAEEMRVRLEAEGFRTRMEKSGRLHVVLLLIRGQKASVEEVREALSRMRLGEPIERSRKVVSSLNDER